MSWAQERNDLTKTNNMRRLKCRNAVVKMLIKQMSKAPLAETQTYATTYHDGYSKLQI